jgi:hypothetical protein
MFVAGELVESVDELLSTMWIARFLYNIQFDFVFDFINY